MSASVHGEGGRPGLRWVLALVLLFDLCWLISDLYLVPGPETPVQWSPAWLLALDQMVWPVIGLLLIAGLATAGFARGGRAQLWFGLVTLVAFALIVETMNAHTGYHQRRYYAPGAVLLGWLAGLGFARLRGADEARSERLGEAGGAAALAATYVNAGVQKLMAGSLFADHSLQAHILTHHQIDDSSLFGALARHVALHPQLAMSLALTTVLIQAGAWMYIVGPRARMLWGTLMISFHLGTLVFLHIIYLEATILLVAWSYPWARIVARLRRAPTPIGEPEDPPIDYGEFMLLAGVAMLAVGVAWVVPTPDEVPQYNHGHEREPEPDRDREAPPGNTVAKLGPLEVGGALGSWVIESIEIGQSDARVHAVREGLRASFGFSGPAGDAPPGPFSAGDLHIYYNAPEGVDAAALADGGEALRERLSADAEHPRVAVDAMIEAARASLPKAEAWDVAGHVENGERQR